MPFVENFDEFKERQGCECVRFPKGWIFENGAVALDHNRFGGRFIEPPSDSTELFNHKATFLHCKLERKKTDYTKVRRTIETQLDLHVKGFGPPPRPGYEEYLQKQIKEINELQRLFDENQALDPSYQERERIRREMASIDLQVSAEAIEKLEAVQNLPDFDDVSESVFSRHEDAVFERIRT